ncbi:hypothetical protein COF85_21950 [Bacillus toyonensis]|uniref:helix-turn-helix domain-containing protein n=1 Tax=Bacillus toyonensis TaxID=155322 RepID=UPI000BFC437A|nr:helix-turn-helix transcriptional regulator [Bacillus toyonensis]PHF35396.1 hypothetical protein COF85_21950 [Bacillus toyonensis]
MKFTGNDLKRTRTFLRLSQTDFARLIGSKQRTVSKAEQSNHYVSGELNNKVNKGLKEQGIDPETLFVLIVEVEEVLKKKFGLRNQDK